MTVSASGFHHVAIKARDVEGLATFYTDVVGLALMRTFRDDAGVRSLWLTCGPAILMIERSEIGGRGDHDFAADPPGVHLVAFAVTARERQRLRAHLLKAGVALASETDHTLYVQDPEGNRLGFSSWPD